MKGKLERAVFDFGEDRVECIELLLIIIVILVRLERDLYSHAMILSCWTDILFLLRCFVVEQILYFYYYVLLSF